MGGGTQAPSELADGWPYQIVRRLGEGATSTVWLAEDMRSRTPVALKVGRDVAQCARLAEEAERLLLVDSPALASVRDARRLPRAIQGAQPELAADLPCVVLEWVDGARLSAASCEDPLRFALEIARDTAEALEDLHEAGFSHGDVKPDNVVVRREGSPRAVLVDLGLGADVELSVPLGGTLRYLSPEVTAAGPRGDGRARDLYALGLTVAETFNPKLAQSGSLADAAIRASYPEELGRLIRPLLAQAPGARPPAAWVRRAARRALGEQLDEDVGRRRRRVRRTYYRARSLSMERLARRARAEARVEGLAGAWLRDAADRLDAIRKLRGLPAEETLRLDDLDVLGRLRWLTALVGAEAASWPVAAPPGDSALAERLLALCEHAEPAAFTYNGLVSGRESQRMANLADPIGVALALAAPSTAVLDAAERMVEAGAPPELGLALGRALRLRGELPRALTVLGRVHSSRARVEAADVARRAGDTAQALALLEPLGEIDGQVSGRRPAGGLLDGWTAARAAATHARIALDRGDVKAAEQLAERAGASARSSEVVALAALARGDYAAAKDAVERGRALAADDEERCRIEAVGGNVLHATGEATGALRAFRRAVDHATRAGAVLEEATYLTGIAATAYDCGELAEALAAGRRAALLFEHLGRPAEAARALLTQAAVYAAARAVEPAREAALYSMASARKGGDVRCRAFAHLAVADALGADSREALEHVRRAAALLDGGASSDRLRAAARLLAAGEDVDVARFDALCREPDVPGSAQIEWWGARAGAAASVPKPIRADSILTELAAHAAAPAPLPSRGEALAAGMRLAAHVGDGEAVRRFAQASADAARTLTAGAPPELRTALAAVDWIAAVRSPRETAVLPEQIADIESLVRALGTRDRLRPLLDQVLDALVLWTGVERGLLLLRAPGDRLVPRAARNLARSDLNGQQLALSRTLAERALLTQEPVVAVDAAGELPEVHQSVHALRLRSVLAVPLLARGEALGVVYLDDRVRRGAFGPRELAWVRLVAALAAVAIADARDQLELRRAARRARRAEERLGSELARREAQLVVAQAELARARNRRPTRFDYEEVIGESEAVFAMLKVVDRVTQSDVPVLITGESGSGKELVARAIHRNGARASEAFVTENCGAIPEGLLESALFGHVRGAFTGASRPKAGLFEVADRGTLFLDEIGEMSLGMQTKLLRVLEDGEIRPVGSERMRKVDVRVIAATHRDLAALVEAGRFRQDLFYRLNVITIAAPPLRERGADIEQLARHFVLKHKRERPGRLSRAAIDCLLAYSWPGNIRQLENEVRRALVLADDVILPEHLSADVRHGGAPTGARADGLNIKSRVDALEADLVRTALDRTGGNQTRAAELLGLSRFGLQKMMKRLSISGSPRSSPIATEEP